MVNPDSDPRYDQLANHYHSLMERKGVSSDYARREVRRRPTLLGALLLKFGYGDGMICGTYGMHGLHLKFIETVSGRQKGVRNFYTMNLLSLPGRTVFLCDTYVNYDPTPEQVVEMTRLAADEVRRFGIQPRIALLSHSSFGTDNSPTAEKMRKALVMLHSEHQDLEVKARCTATRPLMRHPEADLPQRQDEGRCQPADLPDPGCSQHCLQPAQDGCRRRHDHRPHSSRFGQAGAYPDGDGHRAPDHQHDRADSGRSRALIAGNPGACEEVVASGSSSRRDAQSYRGRVRIPGRNRVVRRIYSQALSPCALLPLNSVRFITEEGHG
jgi:hypothetical protein